MSHPDSSTDLSISPPYLVVLGCGTSTGVPMIGCKCPVCTSSDLRNHRTRTGIAVVTSKGNLLIDTPPELRLQLIREQIDSAEAVLYTHSHADHVLGLDDLRIFGYRRKASLPLYCEPDVQGHLRRMFAYAFDQEKETLHSRPMIHFENLSEQPFELLGLAIQPIPLIHGETRVLGFRIGNVAFCTDCNAIPAASEQLLQGLDVLILDALHEHPHPTHFSISEAIEVIGRLGPREAYLTHLSHQVDYAKTSSKLPQGIHLAYDGLRVPIVH
jgi:phosphoribosyl 1,2-cyclic phosphate phosphodiesterase